MDNSFKKRLEYKSTFDELQTIMKTKIPFLKRGQRLRNKRDKTIYEIKSIKNNTLALISENGIKYILIRMNSITLAEYEPVYD